MNMDTIITWMVLAVLICASIALSIGLQGKQPSDTRLAVPPTYTNHARERMLQRQVRQHQIDQVLAKPSRTVPDRENGSVRLEREVDGRVLKVWVVAEPWETAQTATVKTTAWADLGQTFEIPPERVGLIIGLGGSTVRRLEVATDSRISIDRTGLVRISAGSRATLESTKQRILKIIDDADGATGNRYRAA